MTKRLIDFQIILLFIALLLPANIFAERYAVPINDLIAGTENIIVGKVIELKETDEKIEGCNVALAQVQILEVLKGELKINDKIEVITASLKTNSELSKDERILLKADDINLLFINPNTKSKGTYQTYSPQNGSLSLLYHSTEYMIQLGKYIDELKKKLKNK